ncbi:MAG: pyrroloquinoline quinone biosynthesis protein C [Thaumarchaeota archaeon]|nr:pyrroloquinoline quinone biosynthesis protein C [Nitrososphaerota archaeon]
MPKNTSKDEFERELKRALEPRYVDKHPFMQLLYRGRLTKKQVQAWIINRFYLQNSIGSKDAAIISNCPFPEVRRIWISRALRREGMGETVGDIDGWLEFAEAAGLRRERVLKAHCLPGVKFAVEGLMGFVRRASWLEGVATSLYEVPAKGELLKRVAALKTHYEWIRPSGMRFFVSRIARIDRDAASTVDLVTNYANDRSLRRSALSAALFMSDVTWSIHDAIYVNYVTGDVPLPASL